MKQNYKHQFTLQQRKDKTNGFFSKYPDMTPIIVEKHKHCTLPDLQRVQYLVNKTVSFSEFKNQIKSKLQLTPSQSLFLYSGGKLISEDQKIEEAYALHKDKEDGFLYLQYSQTEAFGR